MIKEARLTVIQQSFYATATDLHSVITVVPKLCYTPPLPVMESIHAPRTAVGSQASTRIRQYSFPAPLEGKPGPPTMLP